MIQSKYDFVYIYIQHSNSQRVKAMCYYFLLLVLGSVNKSLKTSVCFFCYHHSRRTGGKSRLCIGANINKKGGTTELLTYGNGTTCLCITSKQHSVKFSKNGKDFHMKIIVILLLLLIIITFCIYYSAKTIYWLYYWKFIWFHGQGKNSGPSHAYVPYYSGAIHW